MNTTYQIRIGREHLQFSAAHFITFATTTGTLSEGKSQPEADAPIECESIHGHNYGVSVELETATLDRASCVVDFLMLRDTVQQLIGPLDHKVLLPSRSETLQVSEQDAEIEVRFASRRWIFPACDCLLMDIANTSAESLAQWIGQRLAAKLSTDDFPLDETSLLRMTVAVDEYQGMTGSWVMSKTAGQ